MTDPFALWQIPWPLDPWACPWPNVHHNSTGCDVQIIHWKFQLKMSACRSSTVLHHLLHRMDFQNAFRLWTGTRHFFIVTFLFFNNCTRNLQEAFVWVKLSVKTRGEGLWFASDPTRELSVKVSTQDSFNKFKWCRSTACCTPTRTSIEGEIHAQKKGHVLIRWQINLGHKTTDYSSVGASITKRGTRQGGGAKQVSLLRVNVRSFGSCLTTVADGCEWKWTKQD